MRKIRVPYPLGKVAALILAAWSAAVAANAAEGERMPIGAFVATRFAKSPVIDGVASVGEWDRAFTTEGMLAAFEQELQESVTVMSLGYDADRIYFLMRCTRGNQEWNLPKISRQNDDYDFSEPSVEIWVTPPAQVPETYQNVINTFPAVMDVQMIPSRGYSGMGWKGNWKVAVKETETDYTIEASVPIHDFGPERIQNGDVWRFLLCRTCHGAKPRAQASWSVTQGFAEISSHVPVRFMEDAPVLQLTGTHTFFTGHYSLPVSIVASRRTGVEVDVELRFHDGPKPGGTDDKVESQHLSLKAGERKSISFAGDVPKMKKNHVTVSARQADGTSIFQQSFAFPLSNWKPQKPVRPTDAVVEQLKVSAQYGPQTNTILVKADLLDLPGRERVGNVEVKVVDPGSNRELARGVMRPPSEWYTGTEVPLKDVEIPVDDFRKVSDLREQIRTIQQANEEKKKKGLKLEELPTVLHPAARKVNVVVTAHDKSGRELKSATRSVDLLRYAADWMDERVGVTEKVIPPWTPVKPGPDGTVEVWNRKLTLDGLGLAREITNGGVKQLAGPMRLVAVKDGKEIEIRASAPRLVRSVENSADFEGAVDAAGLNLKARTHTEFDGFVKVDLDIAPAGSKPTRIDRLMLEVTLPAAEATHFCTTAGGWNAVHDALPNRWTSQSTGSGMLNGDFVPYIWLTNSDRAFLWFADHDKGWNHDLDRALPTQEIIRKGDCVLLKVNFFEIPTEVTAKRTISWGWQTFPSKPLPAGWRATYCNYARPVPHTTATYFWIDADWAVLWPYYCSPFPWSMDKSRMALSNARKRDDHRPCVGSIAHSIGRYRDYEGNEFPGLAVDWGAKPGAIGNSDVTASEGPNNFRAWHYRKWMREAGFCGLYVDENYLGLEENTLTGNAYWRPDGRLQRAYNYIGLRDYFKRLKVVFHESGVAGPNLWQHVSSGAAYHAWPGDIFFEGENVEPTDLTSDYLEVLPANRMRAIGSSICAGGVMTMMCQSDRHRTQWHQKHTHQFVGWVMAHDIIPEQVPLYPKLAEAGHLWEDGVQFLPYWKPSPFKTVNEGCLVSAHATQNRALLWIVNTSRREANVKLAIDWKSAGFDVSHVTVTNAETGTAVAVTVDGLTISVLERDFVPLLITSD